MRRRGGNAEKKEKSKDEGAERDEDEGMKK
jgi:hypothetical protein